MPRLQCAKMDDVPANAPATQITGSPCPAPPWVARACRELCTLALDAKLREYLHPFAVCARYDLLLQHHRRRMAVPLPPWRLKIDPTLGKPEPALTRTGRVQVPAELAAWRQVCKDALVRDWRPPCLIVTYRKQVHCIAVLSAQMVAEALKEEVQSVDRGSKVALQTVTQFMA